MSPASTRPLALVSMGVAAVLVRVRLVAVLVGVRVVELEEVSRGSRRGSGGAVAVLVTVPASTSAWVMA